MVPVLLEVQEVQAHHADLASLVVQLLLSALLGQAVPEALVILEFQPHLFDLVVLEVQAHLFHLGLHVDQENQKVLVVLVVLEILVVPECLKCESNTFSN